MVDYTILLIILAIVFVIGLITVLVIVLNSSKKTNDLHNELTKSIYDIRNNLNKDFLEFNSNINGEFSNFSERISSNLIQTRKDTNEVFNSITERMVKIDEAQKGLNDLSKEVVSLQSILTDKKSRGTFGEVELYSLLEAAYGTGSDRYAKQYKLPNDYIADAVIFGGESLGLICVDSKFPLENYRRMYQDDLNDKDKENAKKQFRDDVKKHINDIKNKYIVPGVTADLAYMFIPAEAIFSEIYANFEELVEYSYGAKVYIVSPTTLMAYITAIKSIYLGQKKDEKAKEIELLLAELSSEFKRFEKRNDDLYKLYENLGSSFYDLKTTGNKIVKKFNKINTGEIYEDDDINEKE